MKKHLHNFGLLVVLIGLMVVPILGYSFLLGYESSTDVLSETDMREEVYSNLDYKKVILVEESTDEDDLDLFIEGTQKYLD